MKTTGDFLTWLTEKYQHIGVGEINVTLAVYEYYNIDVPALEAEMRRMQERRH